jgi:hypothetical protein
VQQPGWTDSDVSDPGITLVEVFDFLADGLARFTGLDGMAKPPRGRVVAVGVAVGAGLLWWRARKRSRLRIP